MAAVGANPVDAHKRSGGYEAFTMRMTRQRSTVWRTQQTAEYRDSSVAAAARARVSTSGTATVGEHGTDPPLLTSVSVVRFDVSGTVASLGPGCERFAVGDEVTSCECECA